MITKTIVASFDVDPQKGFTPVCPDELPVPDGDNIVGELLENHKFATIHVASKDWHHPEGLHIATEDKPQFSPVGGDYLDMDIHWNKHCTAGTKGSEFLDGLPSPNFYDFIAYKGLEKFSHPYGACYHDFAEKKSTGVIEYLKSRGVTHIVVGGLATDYCVKLTVLQLRKAGFVVLVNLAACRGIDEGTTSKAFDEMIDAGAVICGDISGIKDRLSKVSYLELVNKYIP